MNAMLQRLAGLAGVVQAVENEVDARVPPARFTPIMSTLVHLMPADADASGDDDGDDDDEQPDFADASPAWQLPDRVRVGAWKLNLMAVTPDARWLCVATSSAEVLAFPLLPCGRVAGSVRVDGRGGGADEDAVVLRLPQVSADAPPHDINMIEARLCGGCAVVVVVTMEARVFVFALPPRTDNVLTTVPPMVLDLRVPVPEDGQAEAVDSSVWSISVSASTPNGGYLVAVGSNSTKATVVDLTGVLTADVQASEPVLTTIDPCHDHNVPALAWDNTGTYLATVSIDETVAIWHRDPETGAMAEHKRLYPGEGWCWNAVWVDRATALNAATNELPPLHVRFEDGEYFVPAEQPTSPSQLLVVTFQTGLALYDPKLGTADEPQRLQLIRNVVDDTMTPFLQMHRCCFLEYCADLATLLVGSQAGDSLAVFRVVFFPDLDPPQYRLVRKGSVPPVHARALPILGYHVARVDPHTFTFGQASAQSKRAAAQLGKAWQRRVQYRVYVMYVNGDVECWRLEG